MENFGLASESLTRNVAIWGDFTEVDAEMRNRLQNTAAVVKPNRHDVDAVHLL